MDYVLRLPDLGEGVVAAEVVRWLVAVDQDVVEDEPLVEVETDKAIVQMPSPVDGTIAKICVAPGRTVRVGDPLVVIAERVEAKRSHSAAVTSRPPVLPAPALPPKRGAVKAYPAVRRLAADRAVRLEEVRGTGPGGAILSQDVEAAAKGGAVPKPLAATRRSIAERLSRAHREVAAVTIVEECDFGDFRARFSGYMRWAMVLKIVAHALERHPALNATVVEHGVLQHADVDLGFAVQTRRALLVPVVRGVNRLVPREIASDLRRLIRGARAGSLQRDQLQGSTFTVTDAGRFSGVLATPLVNYPEVAILGVHRPTHRPVVRNGEVVIREIAFLSCTFDHRVADGAEADAFLLDVVAGLQASCEELGD